MGLPGEQPHVRHVGEKKRGGGVHIIKLDLERVMEGAATWERSSRGGRLKWFFRAGELVRRKNSRGRNIYGLGDSKRQAKEWRKLPKQAGNGAGISWREKVL